MNFDLFQLNFEHLITFFLVLVRYSVLFSVLPFIGDHLIPPFVKIIFALIVSLSLFPSLLSSKKIDPQEAISWVKNGYAFFSIVALEVIFALILGFTAKMIFEGISFGAHLVGIFMGFTQASIYDPHQETQTQTIAQFQNLIAMLIFLLIQGHHWMIRCALESYQIIGIGQMNLSLFFGKKILRLSQEVFYFGIQITAPILICLFFVNIGFGMLAKAIPQLNVLILLMSTSIFLGFFIIAINIADFLELIIQIFEKMHSWIISILYSLRKGK